MDNMLLVTITTGEKGMNHLLITTHLLQYNDHCFDKADLFRNCIETI